MSAYFLSLQDFFQYSFLTTALIGTLFLSLSCGLISPMVVARRYAFLGSALSHSTLLGLAISMSFLSQHGQITLFASTLLITIFLTLFLAHATYRQKTPSDALIGIFYTVTMGLGIIVHAKFSQGRGDLMGFLFGNILLIEPTDLWISGVLAFLCLVVLVSRFKDWSYILYDIKAAKQDGLPTAFYHYLLFILMTVVIVSALKIAGTVLVSTLLIIPGVFALNFARNMKQLFVIAAVFSLLSSLLGLSLANFFNLPSGATLAVAQFGVLALSLGFKKLF